MTALTQETKVSETFAQPNMVMPLTALPAEMAVVLTNFAGYLTGAVAPNEATQAALFNALAAAFARSAPPVLCVHLKTGNRYWFLGVDLDCTNARNGGRAARYVHADKPQDLPVYNRELSEFYAKFKRADGQAWPALEG